jgi:hypothetical protein
MIDGQGLIIELLSSSPAPDLYAGVGRTSALQWLGTVTCKSGSVQQWKFSESATKVDILGIHTEHLMSIERLIGDKVSNEQGDQDLVGYALPK